MSSKTFASIDAASPSHASTRAQILGRLERGQTQWIVADVLLPLLFTRVALVLAGWFAAGFPANPNYPIQEAVARGWHFSPHRILDIWGRWDTGWYFSIIRDGYYLNGDVQTVQSNIAFFPLYPYLVKGILFLIPDAWETQGLILLVGVLFSNTFLLISLILLYRMILSIFSERTVARYSIAYLLAFPTSFFLSGFYTESLFLLLAVSALGAASKRIWWLAALCGCLLGLTRPLGILIMAPLLWIYFESIAWKPRKIRWHLLLLILIPLGLLIYLFSVYQLTGSYLAPMQIQQAWQRELMSPLKALLDPTPYTPYITPVAQVLTVVFLLGSLLAFWLFPTIGYGLYSILMLAPTLIHGTLQSNVRYYLVIFPVFVVVARLIRRRELHQLLLIVMFTLQILYMVAWSQFFWVE